MRQNHKDEYTDQQQDEGNFTQLESSWTKEFIEPFVSDTFNVADVLEPSTGLNSSALVESTREQAHLFDLGCPVHNPSLCSDPCALSTWQLHNASVPSPLLFHRPTDLNLEALKTFPFLGRLTSVHGLGNTFECGDFFQRSTIVRGSISASTDCVEDLATWQCDTHWVNSYSSFANLHAVDPSIVVPTEILKKSEEIITTILQGEVLSMSTRKGVTICSLPLDTACRRFFSPQHLQRYLSLYWSCWHPNWPVMHRPSFSVSKTSTVLVAAMAVIGACLSTMHEDCSLARLVFDTVEDAVFNDEVFSDYRLPMSKEDRSDTDVRNQLEILLAAYCVCLYQTWEGTRISKRRTRRLRYHQIIGVGPIFVMRAWNHFR